MRNVIFDIGGVMLDWNPERLLEGFYRDPKERVVMHAAIFLHADWLALDQGLLSEAELLARIAQRAGRPVPELDDLFRAVRESLVLKPDSVALLRSLAARQVPLYCLSNMPAKAYAWLRERFDFWALFSGIVISSEIGMIKPQPQIFTYLLARFGLLPAQTIFIDDSATHVAAAQSLGLHTVHFRDAQQCALALQQLL